MITYMVQGATIMAYHGMTGMRTAILLSVENSGIAQRKSLSAGEYVPPWPAKNGPLTYNSQIPDWICWFSQSYRCPPFYAAKLFMVGCPTIHRQVYSLKLLFRIMFEFFWRY